MSRVDVIIPCHNYARFLPDCVGSVLSQPVDLRILIIDDASTDESERVGKELAAQDARIEVRSHPANRGAIATYNEGLEWVSGDYHVLLSADDALTPGALARAVHVLDSEPGVGLTFGRDIRFEDYASRPAPRTASVQCSYRLIRGADFIEASCGSVLNYVPAPCVVLRTSLLERAGAFRPNLTHMVDMTMWLMYASHADVALLDAEQAYYRIHSTNMATALYDNPLFNCVRSKGVIDAVLEHAGPRLPAPERLRSRAYGVIGARALGLAYRAFYEKDRARCREAIAFAVECCPDIVHEKLYRSLKLKVDSRIGPAGWNLLRRLTLRAPITSTGPAGSRVEVSLRADPVGEFEKLMDERGWGVGVGTPAGTERS